MSDAKNTSQFVGFQIDGQQYAIRIDQIREIVILEQVILPLSNGTEEIYKRLLQMNRTLVHGAFVLDDKGETLLFRDTLQLENLDRNELEASIQALSLALAEYSQELLNFAEK